MSRAAPAMQVAVAWTAADATVPAGSTAVIIDVLRATTTLTVALAHGAATILPVATVDDAFALKRERPQAWLCGERGGRMVPGFERGNSPYEFMGDDVAGRTLVFASTNGSQAMVRARAAARRLLGAFVNASALLETLAGAEYVTLACAGKEGRFALEDAACAGWIASRLAERGARLASPAARCALALAPRDGAEIEALVAGSQHGRYLRGLGGDYARDVEFAARLDTIDRAFEL